MKYDLFEWIAELRSRCDSRRQSGIDSLSDDVPFNHPASVIDMHHDHIMPNVIRNFGVAVMPSHDLPPPWYLFSLDACHL
jgi:hypothetical protein